MIKSFFCVLCVRLKTLLLRGCEIVYEIVTMRYCFYCDIFLPIKVVPFQFWTQFGTHQKCEGKSYKNEEFNKILNSPNRIILFFCVIIKHKPISIAFSWEISSQLKCLFVTRKSFLLLLSAPFSCFDSQEKSIILSVTYTLMSVYL